MRSGRSGLVAGRLSCPGPAGRVSSPGGRRVRQALAGRTGAAGRERVRGCPGMHHRRAGPAAPPSRVACPVVVVRLWSGATRARGAAMSLLRSTGARCCPDDLHPRPRPRPRRSPDPGRPDVPLMTAWEHPGLAAVPGPIPGCASRDVATRPRGLRAQVPVSRDVSDTRQPSPAVSNGTAMPGWAVPERSARAGRTWSRTTRQPR